MLRIQYICGVRLNTLRLLKNSKQIIMTTNNCGYLPLSWQCP